MRVTDRAGGRHKRVATTSVAAIPGEAIPILGFGTLVAGTAHELYEACDSMQDLDALYAGLGLEDELPGDVVREVFRLSLPVYSKRQSNSAPASSIQLAR